MFDMIIPLFKSHYSIGKSILTLDEPKKTSEDGPDSIFSIIDDEKLKEVFFVEDSMVGFLDLFKKCRDRKIKLNFGFRLTCCSVKEDINTEHKIIVFASGDDGCKDLYKIYSAANESESVISEEEVWNLWTDNLILAIPFYDSFIFNNNFYLKNCTPNLYGKDPVFFIEKNDLPFDEIINRSINKFCAENNFTTQNSKSIYYKNRADFDAFTTYKLICSRSFGKQKTLSCPNLNHFASNEFCWESYKQASA